MASDYQSVPNKNKMVALLEQRHFKGLSSVSLRSISMANEKMEEEKYQTNRKIRNRQFDMPWYSVSFNMFAIFECE